jgi:PAS domain S-box-containing protein
MRANQTDPPVDAHAVPQPLIDGLLDASPFGVLLVDDQGRILRSNAALQASLGYSREALTGQPLSLLLPPRYRDRHAGLMHGYAQEGRARMMGQGRDLTALHADGSEVAVEIGLNRIDWQGQTVTLAVITDIHTRKRMEQDLRQANADMQEFSYVVSHDLKSPLRGISDLVDWIDQDLAQGDLDAVRHNLDRVRTRIQRMEHLIEDLLRYARAGKVDKDFRAADLSRMLTAIQELQPLPAGFTLSQSLEASPFQAVLTPLETVLRNLLANAIKHHDRPIGHIHVAAQPDGDHMLITVTDDGPGIPPQAAQRIFRLFQTLTASSRGQSGIGLAVCKRLAEVHGGRIDVVSPVADGRGAQFRVWWPRYPRRAEHA